MKKILFAIGFLLISTAELAAQSLSEIINQKETILVDVRTPEEFAQGNVKNSINIPITELENNLSKLEGKKNIVVFCKAGIRAAKAEKILKDKKIKNVYNGKTWENVKSLVKTNLDNSENYNSEKPHFNILRDSEKVKQVAVSLGKNGVFKKHKTNAAAFRESHAYYLRTPDALENIYKKAKEIIISKDPKMKEFIKKE